MRRGQTRVAVEKTLARAYKPTESTVRLAYWLSRVVQGVVGLLDFLRIIAYLHGKGSTLRVCIL